MEFTNYNDLINYFSAFDKAYWDEKETYVERHHSIPKCEGGKNSKIVLLPIGYHAYAHFLRGREMLNVNRLDEAYRNLNAARMIFSKPEMSLDDDLHEVYVEAMKLYRDFNIWVTDGKKSKRIRSVDYEKFIEENPTWRKGRAFSSPTGKIWITNGTDKTYLLKEDAEKFLAKHPDWRKGMSKTNFNYKARGNYATTKGKKWVYKDGVRKNVSKDELDEYLANGWELGSKNSSTNLNKIRIHKGDKLINVPKTELQSYLDQGWEIGTSETYKKHCTEAWVKRREKLNEAKLQKNS